MAELFQRDKSVSSRHIHNIFKKGELFREAVIAKHATTVANGKSYQEYIRRWGVVVKDNYSKISNSSKGGAETDFKASIGREEKAGVILKGDNYE